MRSSPASEAVAPADAPAPAAAVADPGAPVERPPPGTPLYVHLPLCVVKCSYCDFYSVPAEGRDPGAVVDTLLREADALAPRRPRTVFLGGGTPSLHDVRDLARLLDGLDACTGFRDSAVEVTVEANPESLDLEKARALVALGVTRLSVGVQSLRPETLALFGRPHDADAGLRALEVARAAGVPRLSADLIYAVPGQTPEAWERDLRRVLAQGLDHLSAYALAFEEGTPLTRWRAEGRVRPLDEERELALFHATRAITAEHGLDAYEISNFAAKGQQCQHNVNYWRNGPYLGLGPSAASRVGAVRRGRPRSVSGWARAVADDPRAPRGWAWAEALPPLRRLAETWWLGLRLAEGVDPARARATAGLPAHPVPAAHPARPGAVAPEGAPEGALEGAPGGGAGTSDGARGGAGGNASDRDAAGGRTGAAAGDPAGGAAAGAAGDPCEAEALRLVELGLLERAGGVGEARAGRGAESGPGLAAAPRPGLEPGAAEARAGGAVPAPESQAAAPGPPAPGPPVPRPPATRPPGAPAYRLSARGLPLADAVARRLLDAVPPERPGRAREPATAPR